MTLDDLNRLPPEGAFAEFIRCCGSTAWAAAMTSARPFDSLHAMQIECDTVSASLAAGDWLEAFAAHPEIGETRGGSAWSAGEQSGMRSADDETKLRLAALNEAYRLRFGYIFIVCATGKVPAEMLALLEARLGNDPGEELAVAADEQRKIARLRLAKLVQAPQ